MDPKIEILIILEHDVIRIEPDCINPLEKEIKFQKRILEVTKSKD